jgi:activator of 2-hydroxyglutaryl-CoA dehydratase
MLTMGVDSGSRGTRRSILEYVQLLTYHPIAMGPGSARTVRAAVAAAIA